MKLNHIILSLSLVIVIIWMIMKYRSEGYEKSDKDAIDSYIIEQKVLDPNVVKDMASKLTTDQAALDEFHNLATQDDRLGLFKLIAEF